MVKVRRENVIGDVEIKIALPVAALKAGSRDVTVHPKRS